jgi:hypothetical protein
VRASRQHGAVKKQFRSTCWNLAAKVKRKLERYNQHVARQRLADFLNRSGER